jgi:hypothetical protein
VVPPEGEMTVPEGEVVVFPEGEMTVPEGGW